jgi:hypothetical protein
VPTPDSKITQLSIKRPAFGYVPARRGGWAVAMFQSSGNTTSLEIRAECLCIAAILKALREVPAGIVTVRGDLEKSDLESHSTYGVFTLPDIPT